MKPIENQFEEGPIEALPPVAQLVAYDLFSTWSLPRLMEAWLNGLEARDELRQHGCPPRYWDAILRAVFIAKVTYFLPNPAFSAREANYLLRLACTHFGYPLTEYRLTDALGAARGHYPVLHQWMVQFIYLLNRQLKERKNPS